MAGKNSETQWRLAAWLRPLWSRNAQSYIEFHAHAAFKIRFASIVGVVTFPLFYAVWTVVFPQVFESPGLRAIGTLLCLVLFLSPYWPSRLQRYTIAFSFVTFVYCLPFFFTFMLLMNDASAKWQLSLMSAMIYLIFLIDTPNVVPAQIIGSGAAMAIFCATAGKPIPAEYWATLPIFAFSFLGMILLNYSGDLIVREKMRAAAALAAHIAHEMRTPLAAIRLDAEKANDYLPRLMDAHAFAVRNGWAGLDLTPEQAARLALVLERITQQSTSANQVIDTLLVNVAGPGMPQETFTTQSMRGVILDALDSYAFRPGQRAHVRLPDDPDFQFHGSAILMRHVIFNLLRNALSAINASQGGSVSIRTSTGTGTNIVSIIDTGNGVSAEQIQQLFVPFRSNSPDGTGTGVGLSFCKLVIEGFGGTIRYVARPGEGARFDIALPAASDRQRTAAG